jgi:hypothetical protein
MRCKLKTPQFSAGVAPPGYITARLRPGGGLYVTRKTAARATSDLAIPHFSLAESIKSKAS